jgi:hypothetical protein
MLCFLQPGAKKNGMQGEQLREDAKELLRVAYEQRAVRGSEGMQVDLAEATRYRGMTRVNSHLDTLVDYMEVTRWVEQDPMYRNVETDQIIRRITARGLRVLREV